jgi:hypothetical protein
MPSTGKAIPRMPPSSAFGHGVKCYHLPPKRKQSQFHRDSSHVASHRLWQLKLPTISRPGAHMSGMTLMGSALHTGFVARNRDDTANELATP